MCKNRVLGAFAEVVGIGAALMMFGWGSMRDPRNDTVAEAQDGRIRKGTHSGDPLDPESR